MRKLKKASNLLLHAGSLLKLVLFSCCVAGHSAAIFRSCWRSLKLGSARLDVNRVFLGVGCLVLWILCRCPPQAWILGSPLSRPRRHLQAIVNVCFWFGLLHAIGRRLLWEQFLDRIGGGFSVFLQPPLGLLGLGYSRSRLSWVRLCSLRLLRSEFSRGCPWQLLLPFRLSRRLGWLQNRRLDVPARYQLLVFGSFFFSSFL